MSKFNALYSEHYLTFMFTSLDIIPENIALAMEQLGHVNFLPVYGLNVYMMLKHDTLVLTKSAALRIQEKLLESLNRNDGCAAMKKYKLNQ